MKKFFAILFFLPTVIFAFETENNFNNPQFEISKKCDPIKNPQSKKECERLWSEISSMTNFALKNISVGNEKNLEIFGNQNAENNFFNKIIKLMLQIIGSLAVLMMIIGAGLMIISNGDENQLTKGKNIFSYTIGGIAVAFLSFAIVKFVFSLIF